MKNLELSIRNAIPKLQDISVGCIVEKDSTRFCIVDDNGTLLQNLNGFSMLHHSKVNRKDFKIIGHPIKLNDVLEWLGLFQEMQIMFTSDRKDLFIWNMNGGAYWNLSSVFLKDQNDELKKKLKELLN
jgi:hypothetical protein